MTLSRALWEENADLAAEALAHPFVRGLADGTLPQAAFSVYVAQDAFFLDAFARAYALALAHSPDRAARDAFAGLLAGVCDELRLHGAYAARWGVALDEVEPTRETQAYVDFVLARAALGEVGLTCAAMTPCMRLYAFLGRELEGAESGSYAEWVETYADPGFEALAATLEQLLDAHAADSPAVHATYRRAMELELAFFSGAHGGGR